MARTGKDRHGYEKEFTFSKMKRINRHAAGMDIGADEIVVCVADGDVQIVRRFGNYTADLESIGDWLEAHGATSIAMESTGVYWIPIFEYLESRGFECLLISSRSLRRVAGKKSDIMDAQWIQTLHSYGLLESSFRPEADLIALRTLLRHRAQLIEHRSPHIQHVHKALLQMNIQLSQAVSDITGVSGLRIITAILNGERDPAKLAALREPGCKKSAEEIGKALTGTWHAEHLFILKQSMEIYAYYSAQIAVCDEEIERTYEMTRPNWDGGELQPLDRRKRNSHSKNKPANPEAIRAHLKRIAGVDLSLVDGFGVSLAQTVVMECGTDTPALHPQSGASVSKFPSVKHFCSWLGLAPKHEISGGKILKNKTLKTKNRAGQAFRMAANSVKQSDTVFGVKYRRMRARLGPAQATVAVAHALARVVYRMLKYKVEYEKISVEEYETQYKAQQLKYMQKRAAKLGYELLPA